MLSFRPTVVRFFSPFRAHKRDVIMGILQVSTWPFYGIMTTLLMSRAMQHIQVPNKHAFMMTLVLFVVGIVLYQAWNAALRNSFISYVWKAYSSLLREYFIKFIQLDNNITERTGTGKMLSIMEKGADATVELHAQTMYLGLGALIQLLFVTYLLTKVTWFAPLILYVFLVVVFLISRYLTKLGNERRWKRDEARDETTRHTVKILMSKFEILLNGKIDEENKRFDELVTESLYYDKRKLFYEHRSFNVPSIMLSVVTLSLFVFVGYKFFYNGTITYAEIVLYLGLVNSLDSGTRDAIQLYKSYAKNFQRVQKLWHVFDTTPVMPGYAIGKDFVFRGGDIVFDNVSFSYAQQEVVKDFSLHIAGGKKTAIVGISGGGKSTLIKLIAGYLHATDGDIRIDGQTLPHTDNLSDSVSLQSYYRHIGYLTQEPSIFDGTIYENLTYALDYEPTQEELDIAIQQAQCQFVDRFTDGLQTQIGEKGVRLSGGQRQRLAIAKIFLKNPGIVLLDEPTSALDSFSEEHVAIALKTLFAGRTVVIIAHRLQTVKEADDILVLDSGTIVERGTHQQLIEHGGVYAKMLELQSGF